MGIGLIFRAHGSAVFKALIPAAVSTLILFIVQRVEAFGIASNEKEMVIGHPYAVGALLAAFSFLIVFRANFAYARYWEACGAVHQMHSKWCDCATALASFHYQSPLYNTARPPAFGEHEELSDILLARTCNLTDPNEMRKQLDEIEKQKFTGFVTQVKRPIGVLTSATAKESEGGMHERNPELARISSTREFKFTSANNSENVKITSVSKLDGGLAKEPSLFLQEFAHMMSLTSAVALSTLRGDFEGTDLPIIEYTIGEALPPVDPDHLDAKVRKGYHNENSFVLNIRWLFSLTRSKKQRSLYNAARPFRVLGGVSDAEMHVLKYARGASAKVALCSIWLQEFITREHLAGSTGGVAAPIISRLYQYLSDGMSAYNQARKVSFVPFPFPHAQVTTLFVFVVVLFMPVLMYSFVNVRWLAYALNFLTVLCFTSMHMVARELENPFWNVPNDVPLTTMQADFNEAMVSMFAGFHPDSWWEIPQPISTSESSRGASNLDENSYGEEDGLSGSAYNSMDERSPLNPAFDV